MGSLMQDLKRQASFFLREKIKTARLALTDATPAQLLTEEVVNGDSMAADGYAMRVISRAAFEVDDYERIVQILHNRLSKFETGNWRASYKALVLLEHLLTHGPQRTAEEFEHHRDSIAHMATFHYVDDKGFNWGLSVKNKSERIVKLLEDGAYLKEERARARKLIVGIEGFGGFSHGEINQRSNESNSEQVLRSKSLGFNDHHATAEEEAEAEADFPESDENANLLATDKKSMAGRDDLRGWMPQGSYTSTIPGYVKEQDHPFWDKKHQTRVSLLSSV